jgi:hypothetical protein
MKRFLEWIWLKKKLHEVAAEPPLVGERDLWWVSFGENVGSEINGKANYSLDLGWSSKSSRMDSFLWRQQHQSRTLEAGT